MRSEVFEINFKMNSYKQILAHVNPPQKKKKRRSKKESTKMRNNVKAVNSSNKRNEDSLENIPQNSLLTNSNTDNNQSNTQALPQSFGAKFNSHISINGIRASELFHTPRSSPIKHQERNCDISLADNEKLKIFPLKKKRVSHLNKNNSSDKIDFVKIASMQKFNEEDNETTLEQSVNCSPPISNNNDVLGTITKLFDTSITDSVMTKPSVCSIQKPKMNVVNLPTPMGNKVAYQKKVATPLMDKVKKQTSNIKRNVNDNSKKRHHMVNLENVQMKAFSVVRHSVNVTKKDKPLGPKKHSTENSGRSNDNSNTEKMKISGFEIYRIPKKRNPNVDHTTKKVPSDANNSDSTLDKLTSKIPSLQNYKIPKKKNTSKEIVKDNSKIANEAPKTRTKKCFNEEKHENAEKKESETKNHKRGRQKKTKQSRSFKRIRISSDSEDADSKQDVSKPEQPANTEAVCQESGATVLESEMLENEMDLFELNCEDASHSNSAVALTIADLVKQRKRGKRCPSPKTSPINKTKDCHVVLHSIEKEPYYIQAMKRNKPSSTAVQLNVSPILDIMIETVPTTIEESLTTDLDSINQTINSVPSANESSKDSTNFSISNSPSNVQSSSKAGEETDDSDDIIFVEEIVRAPSESNSIPNPPNISVPDDDDEIEILEIQTVSESKQLVNPTENQSQLSPISSSSNITKATTVLNTPEIAPTVQDTENEDMAIENFITAINDYRRSLNCGSVSILTAKISSVKEATTRVGGREEAEKILVKYEHLLVSKDGQMNPAASVNCQPSTSRSLHTFPSSIGCVVCRRPQASFCSKCNNPCCYNSFCNAKHLAQCTGRVP